MRFARWAQCSFVTLVFSLTSGVLLAQAAKPITVFLQVKEPQGSSLFQSTFAGALRGLGDVELTTERSDADFAISVLVACPSDDCDRSAAAVGVTVTQPLNYGDVFTALYASGFPIGSATDNRKLLLRLSDYQLTIQHSVHFWGRDVYDRAIRETIAELDTKCFDKVRLLRKPYSDEAFKRIDSGNWSC